jgi:hypothetical protein
VTPARPQIGRLADTTVTGRTDTLTHMTVLSAIVIALSLQAAAPVGYGPNLDAGRKAFDRFALVEAHAAFERAAAFAPTPGDKAVALVWLGAIRAENADFVGARTRFREALALDVGVPVSVNLSPAIHRLVEEERRAVVEAQRGRRPAAVPTTSTPSPTASPSVAVPTTWVDQPLPERPRWALLSGGAVAAMGVVAVGGGAMVGLAAVTQRDSASAEAFQSDAIAEYQKAREGALWANVLYGAGGVLMATGGGLAAASLLGVDQ